MDCNVEQLVDDILKRNNLLSKECLDDKLKKYTDNIFDMVLHKLNGTSYKSSNKKMIDKVYNRLSSSKFRYWVAGTFNYKHPEFMCLLFISSKHNCLIEVNYKTFKNKMEQYEYRWCFKIPDNCKFTPLEILAIYMLLDTNNSNTITSAIKGTMLTMFNDESEDIDIFKKVFFACLDISLDELFSENEYQKIYI